MSDPKPALFPDTPEADAQLPRQEPAKINWSWSMSATIGKLAEALAKAQANFDPVLKDSENPAFRSKYADLATVIEATRKHLSAQGIAIIQMPHARLDSEESTLRLTTIMVHSSGEWIHSELSLPAMMRERLDSQTVGSAITYARRYALSAMTGVAQQDDDGNAATGIGSKEAAQEVAKRKIRESAPHADKNEPITLIPYKEGNYAVTGNSLALLKADITEGDRVKFDLKWSGADKTWVLKGADANMFASIAERLKYKVIWKD